MKLLRCIALFTTIALVSGAAAFAQDAGNIRITLAGDSTVSYFPPKEPKKGWGMFLGTYFDPQVTIDNIAKSGRSTKTFLSEGWWAKVLQSRPNYILIQFGHNDSHAPSRPEHTDPDGLYTQLLTKFVTDARAIGAVPILVTPVQRRTKVDTLLPYVAAMKRVAAETHTTLVDLHASSGRLYAKLGRAGTAAIEATSTDRTHFNAKGAKLIAGLVAKDLGREVPGLRAHLLPTAKQP
ncbi:rhamnogalacturonan acetylesterase RhgT [mine drainage metagenome]|uniref:Rhamnogalacturonan acetylesterase RhgT n=1 Tax=mine drainage metagenome TaxID=410659 RepID=A0A1J5RZY0_9ZZZZ